MMQRDMGADAGRGRNGRTFDEHVCANRETVARLHHVCTFANQLFGTEHAFIAIAGDCRGPARILPLTDCCSFPLHLPDLPDEDLVVMLDRTGRSEGFDAEARGFLAGACLQEPDGHRFGMFWIADPAARDTFSPSDARNLRAVARIAADHLLAERERQLERMPAIFARATDQALLCLSEDGEIAFANDAALQLFGFRREDLLGQPCDILIPARLLTEHYLHGMILAAGAGGHPVERPRIETLACRSDGSEFPIAVTFSVWKEQGKVWNSCIIDDLSDRRTAEPEVVHLIHQDRLTGLFNRDRFESLVQEHCRQQNAGALIILELAGIGAIGEQMGPSLSDTLLVHAANRIRLCLPSGAQAARLGLDQFAILLPAPLDAAGLQGIVDTLLEALQPPFEIHHQRLQVTCALGHAEAGPELAADDLLGRADYALSHARLLERTAAVGFDTRLQTEACHSRAAHNDIVRALRQGEFVLQYQPQVNLEDDSLCGMEALIRWQHPVRGLLPPAEFLPALERSTLSIEVGWWVLGEAVRQMGEWAAAGLPRVKMSVNLFPLQLRSPDFVEAVSRLLAQHGVEARFLELEITETAALTDGDQSLRLISALREIGVGIAFDDFGTGYASLGTLQHYPITTLKIDRGFVRDLLTRQRDAAITRALIMLSRDIGVTTIAEGIETIEQELTLKMMGCDCGQGYLFGRSMPASDIAGLLARLPSRLAAPAMRAG